MSLCSALENISETCAFKGVPVLRSVKAVELIPIVQLHRIQMWDAWMPSAPEQAPWESAPWQQNTAVPQAAYVLLGIPPLDVCWGRNGQQNLIFYNFHKHWLCFDCLFFCYVSFFAKQSATEIYRLQECENTIVRAQLKPDNVLLQTWPTSPRAVPDTFMLGELMPRTRWWGQVQRIKAEQMCCEYRIFQCYD